MSAEKRASELLVESRSRHVVRRTRLVHEDDALHAIETALTPQWAEISTAPRDGSRIMLWDSRDGGFPTFGSWRVGSEEEHGTITHWLPLPTPPEGEA